MSPLMATTVDAGGGGGGTAGGFPEATFTILDDPDAVRSSVAGYRGFARQAAATGTVLQSTTVPSWVGSEGDDFRTRRAQYEPTMSTADTAFSGLVTWVEDFASQLATIKAQMDRLREQARQVWAQLQAALTAQASAAANAASAAAAVAAAPMNPVVAQQAVTGLAAAQDALGQAGAQVAALQGQWEECLRQAEKLHTELREAAEETAGVIRGLPHPPAAPAPAVGGASAVDPGAMPGSPLPEDALDGGAEGAAPASAEGAAPGGDAPPEPAPEEEKGFLSSLKHVGGGIAGGLRSLNPFASDAERDEARREAGEEMNRAGDDASHAVGRVGNGLYGFGEVGAAGAAKAGSFLLTPFDKDLATRLDKTANDAWTDGSGRVAKDGLYTVDVLSNFIGPGGLAKGAAVLGGKALLGAAVKTGVGTTLKAGAGHIASAGVVGAGGRFLKREAATVGEDGTTLFLKYKRGWDAAQRAEADAKVAALNSADLRVTRNVERDPRITRGARRLLNAKPTQDVDHLHDLQLGGPDHPDNLGLLDRSVNRSMGSQIQKRIRRLPDGMYLDGVKILDQQLPH